MNVYHAGPAPVPVQGHAEWQGRREFEFDGGAGSYLGVGILATLPTLVTPGFGLPWAICMTYKWRSEHTIINGRRIRFTGSGASLFGHWITWWLLCIVTVGINSFWVNPRLTKSCVEHQSLT